MGCDDVDSAVAPTQRAERQENLEFSNFLDLILSSRPAWTSH